MATGTLYTTLDRAHGRGYVRLVREEIVNGRACRSYGLSESGAEALHAEAARMAESAWLVTSREHSLRARGAGRNGSRRDRAGAPLPVAAAGLPGRIPARAGRGDARHPAGGHAAGSRRWPTLRDGLALFMGGLLVRSGLNQRLTMAANLRLAVLLGLAFMLLRLVPADLRDIMIF